MKKMKFISAIMAIVLTIGFTSCKKNFENLEPSTSQEISKSSNPELKSGKVYATSFMWSHAVYYATRWTNNSGSAYDSSPYNPYYDNFNPNDCANFISQTLCYAGLPMESGVWEFDPNRGTTKYDRATLAWRSVTYLYNYLIGKYYLEASFYIKTQSDYQNYVAQAKKGDLIFSMENASHAMIVTMLEKGWVNGQYVTKKVYYSGHTLNRKNRDLWNVWYELGVNDGFRIIRL